ncbi:hypothetical protein AN936_22075 [Sphingopyxis macrogoltabida]|uniref:Uncharacterized protein n=2 Tax=Sphingopyxis macrogoltabida TaxID=33050 RepID=A0A0N9USK3_SPHMC|nr:hypothetical protein AN936_22075 [Sphingopyxis macrogoltabida]
MKRSTAQFFFEMGFGACYAEAIIRNSNKIPFALSDAEIERQWAISQEAYDDPAELDEMLAKVSAADSDVIGKLVEALSEAGTVLRLVEKPSEPDPDYHDRIAELGDEIGYGALMSGAQAAWREALVEYGAVGGEFVAGPCQATVTRALGVIRAALAETQP